MCCVYASPQLRLIRGELDQTTDLFYLWQRRLCFGDHRYSFACVAHHAVYLAGGILLCQKLHSVSSSAIKSCLVWSHDLGLATATGDKPANQKKGAVVNDLDLFDLHLCGAVDLG